MESTFSLLKYFQRIRENFDNLDVIEEFGVNEALKYDPNDHDYLEKLRGSFDETDGYQYDETQEQQEDTPPPATPPADSETPPADSETTPPESETPPADSETPPADSETPPADSETPPPVTPEELASMNGGSPATPNSENIFQDQQNANIVPPTSQTPTSQTPTSQTPTSQTPTSQTPTSQTPTSQTPTSNANSSNIETHSSNIETPTKLPSTIAPPVILPEDTPSNGLPQETIPGQCSSKDLFDFNCYKNLKILLWFLLILITIVIIAFFLYLVNKLVRINNDTPTTKTIKSSSQTGIYYNTPQTVRLEKVNSSPEPKPFLSRLFGFKDDSVDSKSKSSSRKKK